MKSYYNDNKSNAPISVQVGRFLIKNGYCLANSYGIKYETPRQTDCLGILRETPPYTGNILDSFFGCFIPKPRRIHIGDLRINNANAWTLDVFGHENEMAANQLKNNLEKKFGSKIQIGIFSSSKLEVRDLNLEYGENV